MAEHEQIKKSKLRSDQPAPKVESVGNGAKELKSEMDSLLDEIDEVLESNAEEFVKSYIQKGGQ